jgi:hypothetical protein
MCEQQDRELPADWRSKLRECDFALARRHFREVFRTINRLAEDQGGMMYRNEFARLLGNFADRPCFETAAALIEAASPDSDSPVFAW